MATTKKRVDLTLQQKVEVIQASEQPGSSQRTLAEKFGVGKTQIQTILKNKRELLDAYKANADSSRKRLCYRSDYDDIDELTWRWFQRARSQNIPISGPMIQEQAREYAKELHKDEDFKAFNGWLDRFKSRHNIGGSKLSGEQASVDPETVHSWKERLPEIINGYNPCDIYNMDETGLFFRALPDRSLVVKGSDCAGGKKSKERLTVALCVSTSGEIEKPLVIGKSLKPRCFKNVDTKNLPVSWTANRKAWMTGNIFQEWLTKFNAKMQKKKRHVLLLLDNAPCHPADLEFSNVTLQFLPSNTTSVLQPLDLGIIQNMNCYYRTQLLRAVLCQVEKGSASEISKSISVLDACHWIHTAVQNVKTHTIKRCFENAGILIERSCSDPPIEGDNPTHLDELLHEAIDQLHLEEPLTLEDYTRVDQDAPATEELQQGWEHELLEDYQASKNGSTEGDTLQSDDEEPDELSPPNPLINNYGETMKWTKELKIFAMEKSLDSVLHNIMSVESALQEAALTYNGRKRQSTLDCFFKQLVQ